jgi:hypothetical protein
MNKLDAASWPATGTVCVACLLIVYVRSMYKWLQDAPAYRGMKGGGAGLSAPAAQPTCAADDSPLWIPATWRLLFPRSGLGCMCMYVHRTLWALSRKYPYPLTQATARPGRLRPPDGLLAPVSCLISQRDHMCLLSAICPLP